MTPVASKYPKYQGFFFLPVPLVGPSPFLSFSSHHSKRILISLLTVAMVAKPEHVTERKTVRERERESDGLSLWVGVRERRVADMLNVSVCLCPFWLWVGVAVGGCGCVRGRAVESDHRFITESQLQQHPPASKRT